MGLGVTQNDPLAASLYEASISEDISSARASMRLGFLYANGLGVPRDTAKARNLLAFMKEYPMGIIYLTPLDHGLLPKSPEDVTPSYVEGVRPKIAAEDARRAAEEARREAAEEAAQERYEASHPQQGTQSTFDNKQFLPPEPGRIPRREARRSLQTPFDAPRRLAALTIYGGWSRQPPG